MDKEFKKLGAVLTRSNIAIEWKEYKAPSGLKYDAEMLMQRESELNTICKVLAVGADVLNIKPGAFALMGGVGRLIVLDGNTYGVVKEHMIDMTFKTLPKLGMDEGESQGLIMTDLTQKQVDKFSEKTKYPGPGL